MPPKSESRPNSPSPLMSIIDNGPDHASQLDEEAKARWQSLVGETNDENPYPKLESFSSIRILNDTLGNRSWLRDYNGHLSDLPVDFLIKLENCAPATFSARVADFNENLFYKMQNQCGLEHLGLSSDILHENLGSTQFLVSFLSTETTTPQPPHVDFPWEFLEEHENNVDIGFFPLTKDGMFLQVWSRIDDRTVENIEGEVIYIPYGKLLTLPSGTIHGGGFRSTTNPSDHGNLRAHLYISRNKKSLPDFQTNKYTEPGDKRRELCERYVDCSSMQEMIQRLFV